MDSICSKITNSEKEEFEDFEKYKKKTKSNREEKDNKKDSDIKKSKKKICRSRIFLRIFSIFYLIFKCL